MGAIVGALASLGTWAAGLLAARFGYKIALAFAVLAVYSTIYGVATVALSGLVATIPQSGFTAQALQFFPDTWAVSTAASASLGTAAVMRSIELWRQAVGAISQVSS